METYNITTGDNVTQRDITARFFYIGNRYNDSADEKKYHLETYTELNGSYFGV